MSPRMNNVAHYCNIENRSIRSTRILAVILVELEYHPKLHTHAEDLLAMRRRFFFILVLLCWFSFSCVDARRKQQVEPQEAEAAKPSRRKQRAAEVDGNEDLPDVHYLVEMIGKEMYAFIDCPKYRFYIYMMGYSLPDERSAIIFISTICNVLYGCSIVFGFLFFPRNPMLVWTLCTLYIGPAFILLVFGFHILLLAAFATYPILSVLVIWLWFFLTSQIAQVIGRQLGLDQDKDGDVDMLDLLHYLAHTRAGKYIGLQRLHDRLNRMSMDPFQAIHRRLDQIKERMDSESDLLSKSIRSGSIQPVNYDKSELREKNHSD